MMLQLCLQLYFEYEAEMLKIKLLRDCRLVMKESSRNGPDWELFSFFSIGIKEKISIMLTQDISLGSEWHYQDRLCHLHLGKKVDLSSINRSDIN